MLQKLHQHSRHVFGKLFGLREECQLLKVQCSVSLGGETPELFLEQRQQWYPCSCSCPEVALSPGPSQILSLSRGEKSGECLGSKLRHGPEMVDSVSTNQVHVTDRVHHFRSVTWFWSKVYSNDRQELLWILDLNSDTTYTVRVRSRDGCTTEITTPCRSIQHHHTL